MSRPEKQIQLDSSEMNVLFVHSAIDDYPLTPEEFRLYAHLARRASSGAAYPSVPNMAKACRMHPDTVRRCLTNLLTYRMLDAHERKGKTTLYTLTKFSRWAKPEMVVAVQEKQASEGKAKRAEKKAAKAKSQPDPSETEGGVQEASQEVTPPKRREGYPSEMEGGDPPETKGDEGNPLSTSIEGGVFNVTGDASARDPQPTAPVAVADQAPHTTTEDASLQKTEGTPFTAAPGTPIPSPAVVPTIGVHEQQPPNGGAANAAEEDPLPLAELERMFERPNDQATSTENVPGGAAAGAAPAAEAPRGDAEAVRNFSVALLVPVGRDELLKRSKATLEGPEFKAIRSMVPGALLSTALNELTPTGGLSREDWLLLSLAELEAVRLAAQADAQAGLGKMPTLAIRGLDAMIGAVVASKPSKAVPQEVGGQDPAAVARHDPQLQVGARCRVKGQLGVVFDVRANGYLVDLDNGDRVTVDRAEAKQLRQLVASDAPAPTPKAAVADDVVVLADVGTRWQPRNGGEVVTVKAVEGANRVLSNNARIAVYVLTTKFEQASA